MKLSIYARLSPLMRKSNRSTPLVHTLQREFSLHLPILNFLFIKLLSRLEKSKGHRRMMKKKVAMMKSI